MRPVTAPRWLCSGFHPVEPHGHGDPQRQTGCQADQAVTTVMGFICCSPLPVTAAGASNTSSAARRSLLSFGRYPEITLEDRPISDNTINAALRRLGFSADEIVAHGFRSTASTCLNELGWHPDLIELQLAHAERNESRGAYHRAQRLAERRKMMQAWADDLDALRTNRLISGGTLNIGQSDSKQPSEDA